MTHQYVAGELSLRLEQLESELTDEERSRQVACLRYKVETTPIAALGSVAAHALGLANHLCWESLECGDTLAFSRQAMICADLWEFGVCARLFEDDLQCDEESSELGAQGP